MRFTFTRQNIIRSKKFFEVMSRLDRDGYINICNTNHKKTFYTLTDKGELEANQRSRDSNTIKQYCFLGQDIVWRYE